MISHDTLPRRRRPMALPARSRHRRSHPRCKNSASPSPHPCPCPALGRAAALGLLRDEGLKEMKIILPIAGLLPDAALTACGGAGPSAAYNKGFTFADGNRLVQPQAGMMGPATICGSW